MPTLRTTYPLTEDMTTGSAILRAGGEASRAALRLGAHIVGPVDWHWTPGALVGLAPIRWNVDLDTAHGQRLDGEYDEVAVRRAVVGEQPWTLLSYDTERAEVLRRLAQRGDTDDTVARHVGTSPAVVRRYLDGRPDGRRRVA
jgi:hypothetical protein